MSNRNLQKHLPRGLDEHNFKMVKKRTAWQALFMQWIEKYDFKELQTAYKWKSIISTGIHFYMESYRVFCFCILFSCLYISITVKSLTLSWVSWESFKVSDILWPLFSVALLVFWSTPLLQMDDLEILSILKDGSHWIRCSFSHRWSMLLEPP